MKIAAAVAVAALIAIGAFEAPASGSGSAPVTIINQRRIEMLTPRM